MPRKLDKRSWDNNDESHNFLLNVKTAVKRLNLSITQIEERTTHSGYVAAMIQKQGSVSLVLASRMAYQIGFSLDELIKPPSEFQQILDKDIGGENNDGAQ